MLRYVPSTTTLMRVFNHVSQIMLFPSLFVHYKTSAHKHTKRIPRSKRQSQLLLLSRFSHVRLCATPETAAHQAPPSLGFFRQ